MAFQPIVHVTAGTVFAYEALVRGPQGQSAANVLSRVAAADILQFDQRCRGRAMTLATNLDIAATGAALSINFLPSAIRTPEVCAEMTAATATILHFANDRLIFEVTESERLLDPAHLAHIATAYRRHGFRIAVTVDDLASVRASRQNRGAMHADILKIDMAVTRDIHQRPRAQALLASLQTSCAGDGTVIVAEGVESMDEYLALLRCGVELMQGYLFAMPAFEKLTEVTLPQAATHAV